MKNITSPIQYTESRSFDYEEGEKTILKTGTGWSSVFIQAAVLFLSMLLMGQEKSLFAISAGRLFTIPEGVLEGAIYLEKVIYFAAALLSAYSILEERFTRYIITDRRVVSCHGIVSRHWMAMRLADCITVEIHQDSVNRIEGSGDVTLLHRDGTTLTLDNVRRSEKFRHKAITQMALIKPE